MNRRDAEFRAVQDFVVALGTVSQRTDMTTFMNVRQLFLDNFTTAPPTPGLFGVLAAFFGEVADEIAEPVPPSGSQPRGRLHRASSTWSAGTRTTSREASSASSTGRDGWPSCPRS